MSCAYKGRCVIVCSSCGKLILHSQTSPVESVEQICELHSLSKILGSSICAGFMPLHTQDKVVELKVSWYSVEGASRKGNKQF